MGDATRDHLLRFTRRIALAEWISEARARGISLAIVMPLFDKWWNQAVRRIMLKRFS